jgi:hypothetical protein
MADRVRAAAVPQNTSDADDQRADQNDESENDDHGHSELLISGNAARECSGESLGSTARGQPESRSSPWRLSAVCEPAAPAG